MAHPKILDKEKAALLVIDIQEAFRGIISDFPVLASRASTAIRGSQILGLPVFVTEQYPKGLGRTAEEILLTLPDDFEVIEKTTFSSCGAGKFAKGIKNGAITQVVVCGLETHICVNQTAHDLLDLGFDVHLLTDCVASRFEQDKTAGIEKMKASGVIASSIEMALFELLKDASHDKFKEIQQLIK
jgi:nicotinamidase-related amidase